MKKYIIFGLFLLSIQTQAQSMDEKIKTLANEIADQAVKSGCKKVAVTTLDYKGCNTEFGKFMAEELTGNLSVSGRDIKVVNQKLLESLLEQNKLTAKGLLEAKNDAAKLGQVSGIEGLVYGTITTLGEEIRLSISIVKLPTLEVMGYTKGAFALTSGIKEMLPCIESTASSYNSNSGLGETNLSLENSNLPKPKKDCQTKPSCVVCVTNKSKQSIQVNPYLSMRSLVAPTLLVHPNQVKCWGEMGFSTANDHDNLRLDVTVDRRVLKEYREIIEPCKAYNIIHELE